MSDPTSGVLSQWIGGYVAIRDRVRELEKAHKERLAPLREKLDELEARIMEGIEKTGGTSLATGVGTAYLSHRDTASLADPDAFMRHVIGSEEYDLLDRKANVKAVKEYIIRNNEPPPGVNFHVEKTLGVRAPTKKATDDGE